ncbi:hypothetical protein BDA99DRAFT_525400 [Phascolomyces articulosus]|uniref:Uncharacterized protein n=1 Tax=Phascolomyces articulosus TaxID=60185 RepID=A0AAD5JZ83_9FUNG|nr:hypothetical protein BDA99DRAFT_525400 [Phascolomyces articulosus]
MTNKCSLVLILISPVVEENATSINGLFPSALRYSWYTPYKSNIESKGEDYVIPDSPLTYITLHIHVDPLFY